MKTLSVYGIAVITVLSFLAVTVSGCQTSLLSAQRNSPAAVISAALSQLRQTQQDTQLLLLEQIRPTAKSTGFFVAVVRTGQDQHVVILEPAFRGTGKSPASKTQAYHIAIEIVIPGDPSLILDPEGFDADGDGSTEVFFRLVDNAADRAIVSFLLFSRSSGSWKLFGSPAFQPDLEMKKAILIEGQTHYIAVQDIGDWIVLHRSEGIKFLSLEALRQGQCTQCPYRYRLVVYRFTPGGFEQDLSWNGGQPFVCKDPIGPPGSSTINQWYEDGCK